MTYFLISIVSLALSGSIIRYFWSTRPKIKALYLAGWTRHDYLWLPPGSAQPQVLEAAYDQMMMEVKTDNHG